MMDVLGIDVAKSEFHAVLQSQPGHWHKAFANTAVGFKQLQNWLKNHRVAQVHACMEATGSLWLELALALRASGHVVSVVNPRRIKAYGQSQLRRTKNDPVDAQIIADFCRTQTPAHWEPPQPETLALRGLIDYRLHLVNERTRSKQMLAQLMNPVKAQPHILQHLVGLDELVEQMDASLRMFVATHAPIAAAVELVQSIKGVGFLTAATIVARLPYERLTNSRAAAAFAGLTPREWQSGSSISGKPRICKLGDGSLRRALYMAAISASRTNPAMVAFAARLRENGKCAKVILVAVMRKLLVTAFALLKTGKPYNPSFMVVPS